MEEQIIKLQNEIDELKELFYKHKHLDFDRTKPLEGGSAGGSDTEIQFNDGGSLGGDADFTWNKTTGTLTLGATPVITTLTNGENLEINVKDATSGAGGYFAATGGNGNGSGAGGSAYLQAGTGGNSNANGGSIEIVAGGNSGSGVGGNITLQTVGTSGALQGDIIVTSSVVAATMDHGFLVIPNFAGTPTGTPTLAGSMVYDTTNNKLYIYNGGWKSVTLS